MHEGEKVHTKNLKRKEKERERRADDGEWEEQSGKKVFFFGFFLSKEKQVR